MEEEFTKNLADKISTFAEGGDILESLNDELLQATQETASDILWMLNEGSVKAHQYPAAKVLKNVRNGQLPSVAIEATKHWRQDVA